MNDQVKQALTIIEHRALPGSCEAIVAAEVRRLSTILDGVTHYDGCYDQGVSHYQCALREVGRLLEEVGELRAKLKAAEQVCKEVARYKYHRHLGAQEDMFDALPEYEKGERHEPQPNPW